MQSPPTRDYVSTFVSHSLGLPLYSFNDNVGLPIKLVKTVTKREKEAKEAKEKKKAAKHKPSYHSKSSGKTKAQKEAPSPSPSLSPSPSSNSEGSEAEAGQYSGAGAGAGAGDTEPDVPDEMTEAERARKERARREEMERQERENLFLGGGARCESLFFVPFDTPLLSINSPTYPLSTTPTPR